MYISSQWQSGFLHINKPNGTVVTFLLNFVQLCELEEQLKEIQLFEALISLHAR